MTDYGDVVRAVPRGPAVGRTESVGYRKWIGKCGLCSASFRSDTRPAAAEQVRRHVRQENHYA